MDNSKNISKHTKRLRDAAGLSQPELARKTGISKSTISNMENGRNANTSMPNVLALADAFGIKGSELFKLYTGESE